MTPDREHLGGTRLAGLAEQVVPRPNQQKTWKSSQNLCALTPLCPNSSLVKYICPTSSPAIPTAPPQSPSVPSHRRPVSSVPLLHPSLKLDKIQLQGHLWDPSPPPPGFIESEMFLCLSLLMAGFLNSKLPAPGIRLGSRFKKKQNTLFYWFLQGFGFLALKVGPGVRP